MSKKHIVASIGTDSRNHSHIEKLLDDGYEILNVVATETKVFLILVKEEL